MRLLLATVISVSFVACDKTGGTEATGPAGSATARITQVPDGVACVSITVVGDRTVMHAADVTRGQPAFLQLGGLPVGLDAFSAAAFATPCSLVSGAQPSWATTQPFYASVTEGAVTPLTLKLEPTGGAVIGIDFGDGGSGGPDFARPVDGGYPIDLSPWWPDGGWAGNDLAY